MPADRVALIQNNGYSRDKNGGCRLVEFAEKIKEPGTGKLEALRREAVHPPPRIARIPRSIF